MWRVVALPGRHGEGLLAFGQATATARPGWREFRNADGDGIGNAMPIIHTTVR
jgi:hypothetical protein